MAFTMLSRNNWIAVVNAMLGDEGVECEAAHRTVRLRCLVNSSIIVFDNFSILTSNSSS